MNPDSSDFHLEDDGSFGDFVDDIIATELKQESDPEDHPNASVTVTEADESGKILIVVIWWWDDDDDSNNINSKKYTKQQQTK